MIQYGAGIPLGLAAWLGGLTVLYLGRRPGGDPPAWSTGREEPWPSARAAAEARKAEQETKAEPAAEPPREPVPAGAHPATSRRKRKRRN